MKNEKRKKKKKKECGDFLQLIGGKQTASERFLIWGKGGLDRMGMGRPLKQTLFGTTVQIASIYWVRYSFYLIYLNGNLTAMPVSELGQRKF